MASVTKTQYLVRHLRDEIQAGRWSSGERLPGEIEMQTQFGVSRTTIRDALNILAGEGLVVRRHGTGTYVAETKDSACIAIAADAGRLASPLGYWYRALVEAAQEQIADAGYRAVLAVGNGKSPADFVASTNILNSLKSTDLVGVIDTTSVPLLSETLSSERVNSVVVECAIPIGEYCIVLDYAAYTQLAVEMMQSRGYSDFAILAYDYNAKMPREVGDPVWREFARLRQVVVGNDPDRWIPVPGSRDTEGQSYEAFIKWWKSPKRTNSIFFFDDTLFDMTSKAIIELGIKVPDDLAILTHANVGRRFHFPVRLTRIGFDAAVVMGTAWEMLEKLIKGEPVYEPMVKVQPVRSTGESLGEAGKEKELCEAGATLSRRGVWSRS